MKKNVTISYLILTIIVLIWSCEEQEPFFSPYFLENYPKLLDNLNFYCPDQGSEKIISFDVLNQHNCYYDNIDDRFFIFAMHHTFTTPSPTITTGEKYDSKKLLGLTTHRKSYIYADNNILFYFPMVEEECDDENYLDSIFAINKFEIRNIFSLTIHHHLNSIGTYYFGFSPTYSYLGLPSLIIGSDIISLHYAIHPIDLASENITVNMSLGIFNAWSTIPE